MEHDFNRSLADLVERIKELGGDDELIGKVKIAKDMEAKLMKQLTALHDDFLEDAKLAGLPLSLACACACNVFSGAYALAVAVLGGTLKREETRSGLINTALGSFMKKYDRAHDLVEAKANDISGKILAGAAAGAAADGETK